MRVARRCAFSDVFAATVLAGAGLLAASCSSTPPTPPAAPPVQSGVDLVVADRVYQALNADPVYFFRHVDVRVSNGVADISGYVWTTDAIYRARQIARGVPGVKRVVTSHLELEREGRNNGPAR
jgi:BON domain-containing protein